MLAIFYFFLSTCKCPVIRTHWTNYSSSTVQLTSTYNKQCMAQLVKASIKRLKWFESSTPNVDRSPKKKKQSLDLHYNILYFFQRSQFITWGQNLKMYFKMRWKQRKWVVEKWAIDFHQHKKHPSKVELPIHWAALHMALSSCNLLHFQSIHIPQTTHSWSKNKATQLY